MTRNKQKQTLTTVVNNKRKIINDPVFGFITIPNELLYDLIEHPFVQRLSRIKQLGLASYVYPGAQHTRFQHSLGALYLMTEAIKQLRSKGHEISDEEANGVMAAILLHDIGHGPFSHVLEHTLFSGITHEEISLRMMEAINEEMNGALTLGIEIFRNRYPRKFLHQLISSQLDMDRLDYLRRDCFYTGVVEGEIGSARIIKMLDVCNDRLVVERKGIYSIENFLIARRFMYWQVYLHKTSIGVEELLIRILSRAKTLCMRGKHLFATPALQYFLEEERNAQSFDNDPMALRNFTTLDDNDIIAAIKVWQNSDDKVLSMLSTCFINRRLMKVRELDEPLNQQQEEALMQQYANALKISLEDASFLYAQRTVRQGTYDTGEGSIGVLTHDGSITEFSKLADSMNPLILNHKTTRVYLCTYPLSDAQDNKSER
ncbi:MAG: HD domain-containing protein [Paludibacteraceae bacterium]|nr:HD domain-containing protein [Paludibacteraceae bacterium]